MKIGMFLFGLLLIVIPAVGQEESEKELDWRIISEANEEIDFEMPLAGISKQLPENHSQGSARYESKVGRNRFIVISSPKVALTPFRQILEFTASHDPLCASGDILLFRYYQCTFSELGNYNHAFRVIRTFKRIYILYSLADTLTKDQTGRFLESVVITRELANRKTIDISEIDEVWDQFEAGLSQAALGANAAASGDPPAKQSKSGPIESGKGPLKFHSKPRPGYTALARIFNVTGRVRLRVGFLADGTVGAVSVESGLPFGLTEQAVEAVKKVEFSPEVRDGKKISVTKNVIYQFTIY